MGNIREYTNESTVNPSPLEGTAFSLERYGRIDQESIQQGAAGLADIAHQLQQHEAKNDAADLIAAHAQVDAGLFQAYREKAKDPNAPEGWRQEFLENTVANSYQKLKDSARTPQGYSHAEDLGAQGTYNWTRTVAADQMKEDGEKHIAALNGSVQTSANVVNESPDQLEAEIAKNYLNVRALVPAEKQDAVLLQMRAHLTDSALAGITSLAQKNRTISAAALDGLKSYINDDNNNFKTDASREAFARANDDLQTLINGTPERLRSVANANAADAARVTKAANDQATTEWQRKLIGPNGHTTLSSAEVMAGVVKDDRFTAEGREGIIKFSDYLNNEELRRTKAEETVRTDPKVWDDIVERATNLDPNDPNFPTLADVAIAGHNRQLTQSDAVRASEVIRDISSNKPYKAGLKQFRSFMATEAKQPGFAITDPVTGIKDDTAVDRLNGWRAAAMARWEDTFKTQGAAAADALFDSNSSTYLGSLRKPYMPGASLHGMTQATPENLLRDFPAVAPKMPGVGETRMYKGSQYSFTGGDPNNEKNWKKK